MFFPAIRCFVVPISNRFPIQLENLAVRFWVFCGILTSTLARSVAFKLVELALWQLGEFEHWSIKTSFFLELAQPILAEVNNVNFFALLHVEGENSIQDTARLKFIIVNDNRLGVANNASNRLKT